MENTEDYCKLCGAKLENSKRDALSYCMKCNEQQDNEKTLRR